MTVKFLKQIVKSKLVAALVMNVKVQVKNA